MVETNPHKSRPCRNFGATPANGIQLARFCVNVVANLAIGLAIKKTVLV
jgi:hypothetical protein